MLLNVLVLFFQFCLVAISGCISDLLHKSVREQLIYFRLFQSKIVWVMRFIYKHKLQGQGDIIITSALTIDSHMVHIYDYDL